MHQQAGVLSTRHARHARSAASNRSTRHREHPIGKGWRLVSVAGKALVGVGLFLLAFTAYQLWGTILLEHLSQDSLRSTIDKEIHHVASSGHRTVPGPLSALTASLSTPAQGQPVGVIEVPKIGLNQVIVEGTGSNELRLGPGHYVGTPLPGENGNVAIAGHRTTYGHPFYDLNELTIGDPIEITTPQGEFNYTVIHSLVVSPSDTAVLASSQDATLTLTTCNPRFSASTRLVVQAVLQSSVLTGSTAVKAPTDPTVPIKRTQPKRVNPSLLGPGTGFKQWLVAFGWGLAVIDTAVMAFYAVRFTRKRAIYIGAGLIGAVLLFLFFGAVSPLLPASF